MRIGLVIYGSLDTISGGYLYDRKLAAYLRSRGDDVEIISLRAGSYLSHLFDGSWLRLPTNLDAIIEDELVHPSLLLANRDAPRRDGRHDPPLISLVHNLHSSENRPQWQNAVYREIERRHLDSVDGYIFNSTVTRDTVQSLLGSSKPHVLAPPGGDRLGGLSPEAVAQRVSRSGPLRLLFLANVTPLKGLHILLTALKDVPVGSCLLNVAGSLTVDRAYAARMQAEAAALDVPVTFHGVLEGQGLVELLADSDVLVLPSFWEGFGIAYLEGMAFGLPAIGTTAGAIPQMITHGSNGYLIAPGASATLSRLIETLISDRELLARLSTNALSYFAACPTWDQSGEMVRQFLLKMTAEAPRE